MKIAAFNVSGINGRQPPADRISTELAAIDTACFFSARFDGAASEDASSRIFRFPIGLEEH
ncbi:hypothetical protein ACFOKI_02950 [Sphingomonas qilianensis]|uniref:Uncharacterized protein n=1 Tax=Sphingomonas qilianensis TaxID=1736690 RepID=A0ABU9XVH2_9SPHN